MRHHPISVALMMAIISAGCSSSGSNNNGGDANDFEGQLSDAVQNNLAGFGAAMERFVTAVNGTPQAGVTLTTITNGVQGSVGVDVDGDGTLETTLNGKITYINSSQGLAGGANFTLTSIDGGAPQTASGSAVLRQTGATTVTITQGTFNTHTDTRGNDLSLSNADLTVNVGTTIPVVTGTSHFDFNGLEGTLTFIANGSNGSKIQVSGNGFTTFTVP